MPPFLQDYMDITFTRDIFASSLNCRSMFKIVRLNNNRNNERKPESTPVKRWGQTRPFVGLAFRKNCLTPETNHVIPVNDLCTRCGPKAAIVVCGDATDDEEIFHHIGSSAVPWHDLLA
jgi:hypothetical protein